MGYSRWKAQSEERERERGPPPPPLSLPLQSVLQKENMPTHREEGRQGVYEWQGGRQEGRIAGRQRREGSEGRETRSTASTPPAFLPSFLLFHKVNGRGTRLCRAPVPGSAGGGTEHMRACPACPLPFPSLSTLPPSPKASSMLYKAGMHTDGKARRLGRETKIEREEG